MKTLALNHLSATSGIIVSLCSAAVAWIVISSPVSAAMLAGSQPKDWPANPAKHVVVIKRDAADEKQTAMIAAAEAAPIHDPSVKSPDAVRVWWHEEKLGIRTPFALTGDAVTYYSGLVEQYGKQAFNRFIEPSSRVEYHAGVAFHKEYKLGDKSFNDVHVVTLKLVFSESFAASQTEAMNFQIERVVVLDAAGKVLSVSGDGPVRALVMAI